MMVVEVTLSRCPMARPIWSSILSAFLFLILGAFFGAMLSRSRDLYKEGKHSPGSLSYLAAKFFAAIDQLLKFRVLPVTGDDNLWLETELPKKYQSSVNHVTTISIDRFYPFWLLFLPYVLILGLVLFSFYLQLDKGWNFAPPLMAVLAILFAVKWEGMVWRDGSGGRQIKFVNNNILIDTGEWGFLFNDVNLANVDSFQFREVSISSNFFVQIRLKMFASHHANAIFLIEGNNKILVLATSKYFDVRFGNNVKRICDDLNSGLKRHRDGALMRSNFSDVE